MQDFLQIDIDHEQQINPNDNPDTPPSCFIFFQNLPQFKEIWPLCAPRTSLDASGSDSTFRAGNSTFGSSKAFTVRQDDPGQQARRNHSASAPSHFAGCLRTLHPAGSGPAGVSVIKLLFFFVTDAAARLRQSVFPLSPGNCLFQASQLFLSEAGSLSVHHRYQKKK